LTSQALAALAPNVRLIQSFHETSLVVGTSPIVLLLDKALLSQHNLNALSNS